MRPKNFWCLCTRCTSAQLCRCALASELPSGGAGQQTGRGGRGEGAGGHLFFQAEEDGAEDEKGDEQGGGVLHRDHLPL